MTCKTEKPADFTHCGLSCIREAKIHKLKHVNFGAPPIGKDNKLRTLTVLLSHNNIKHIRYIDIYFSWLLEDYTALKVLDLSYNKLTAVDDALLNLKSLTAVYLHENQIKDVEEFCKMKQLPVLSVLTVHGNPITWDEQSQRRIMNDVGSQIVNLANFHIPDE